MRTASNRTPLLITVLALSAVLLPACGGGGDSGTLVPQTYTVGGTVSIGSASGLVLQNNGGNDLTISADGNFTFSTPIASGSNYSVTVKTQPASPSETCTVSNGTGVIASANVTSVRVSCTVNFYAVSGTVTGLSGSGLHLLLNGSINLSVSANGTVTFFSGLSSAATYTVAVATQPTAPTQFCVVANGSGTVTNADITNITITCAPSYTVGGTVNGLAGSGLVLSNNGGNNLSVVSNGAFAFGTPIATGGTYSVAVVAQPSGPSQTCTVTNGAGTVGGAVTTVAISCATNSYSVGGTVSGLSGAGLVLRNNGGTDLAVAGNGSFTFSTSVVSGGAYSVAVASQPTGPKQHCLVSSGSGSVSHANVTSVALSCHTILGLVYVANNLSNSISVYTINAANGTLTPVAGNPFSTAADPVFVAADPSGRFLYVASYSSERISGYAVDAAYQLVAVPGSPLAAPNGAESLALSPGAGYLYATLQGTDGVLAYAVNSTTGALTSLPGSPFPSTGAPRSVAIDPSGAFAYVANRFGGVSAFTIGAGTGTLSAASGSPYSAGTNTFVVTAEPTGKFVYAGNFDSADISAYSINATSGALASITGSPFAGRTGACMLGSDAGGSLLFVGHCSSSAIDVYTVNASTGALSLTSGSPFATNIGSNAFAIDPTDQYLYATSSADAVVAFAIDGATGSLTAVPNGSVAAGTSPISIAVSQ